MSSEQQDQLLPTPSDFGHFLLEKELGHGGMGGVYLARDKMLDRRVAIKVMLKSLGDDEAFVERFQREAQAAARLNHPNISQIYSFGKEKGMPYIAMELVSGGSLDKEMAMHPGTLDPAYVMKVGMQLADALALAAEQHLVHGDVKPENVLFDLEGNAKLVDFGLAAMQGDSNEIWGTPYYISPEKVRRQKVDFRADIYSLGGTLYHALTGVAPFEGEDATAVVRARFEGAPKRPSEVRRDLPKEVDEIIMRMLEQDPAMRYPTYQSLMGDLKRFLAKAKPSKTSKTASAKIRLRSSKAKLALSKTGTQNVEIAEGEVAEGSAPQPRPLVPKRSNVGTMVTVTVVGVIVLVVAVVGGLLWFVSNAREQEQKRQQAEIARNIANARTAIAENMQAVEDFGRNFHNLVNEANRMVTRGVNDLKTRLPTYLRIPAEQYLSPKPGNKEIFQAIAYTNRLLSATGDEKKPEEKKAEPEKGAATNAPAAAASAATNAPAAAAAAPADGKAKKPKRERERSTSDVEEAAAEKALAEQEARVSGKAVEKRLEDKAAKAAEEKKAEAKEAAKEQPPENKAANDAMQKAIDSMAMSLGVDPKYINASMIKIDLPKTVVKFGDLWDKLEFCRAADIRVQGQVEKIRRMAAKAADLTGSDVNTMNALVSLGKDIYDELGEMKAKAWVNTTQKNAGIIRTNSSQLCKDAVGQVVAVKAKLEKTVLEKVEEIIKAEKAKKHAALMEKLKVEEAKAAKDKFIELVGTRLKTLDFEPALKQLRPMLETFKTEEGRAEAKSQIHKVECMQAMQEQFIQHGKGFKFKDGSTIASIDEKAFVMQKYKAVRGVMEKDKKVTFEWERFYGKAEYVGLMNQLVNKLVLQGRDTTRIGPLPWSKCMLGAALTLKHHYSEVDGADKMAETLVKKAAKEFSDCAKWAKLWFPNVELEVTE